MTDSPEQTPVQQQSGQQGSSAPQAGENWEARYKGSVRKIEELTLKVRDLEGQLGTKSSETEQIRSQLSVKDVEKDVAVSEHRKQLEKALQDKSQTDSELTELRAFKAKVDLAKELKAPHLVDIIDRIPYVSDPEQMKVIMNDFVGWGQTLVKEREAQLMAGTTPGVQAVASTPSDPTNADDWMKRIQATDDPVKKQDLWNKYWNWGQTQK
jgi:chromosome segregation ATPase